MPLDDLDGPDDLDDQALVARILTPHPRAGSEAAFASLLRRYQGLVFRLSYGYSQDRDEALDASQEVFLKVFEKLGSYRGAGSFVGWLVRITHRTNLDRARHRGGEPQWEKLGAASVVALRPEQERDLEQSDDRRLLLAELEQLNDNQRLAVTLRYFEQMSIREIATVLRCSEGNAKSILFRSLDKLRNRPALRRRRDHDRLSRLPRADREVSGR